MVLLDIRNLTIQIKTNNGLITIVESVNITINDGEIVALVGASGSGKSLIAQALMGLRRDNIIFKADRFIILKHDLLKVSSRKRRKILGETISFIMQEPRSCLDPTMRICNQLFEVMPKPKWYNLWGKFKQIIHRSKRNTAIALLHRSGIKDHNRILNAYPSQLSDIECQKVMIAIAIASEPKLIIADEPVSSLEIVSKTQVLKLLDRYNQNDRTSILIICNDLASIANFADRLAIFYAGQIVEVGNQERVLKNPYHPYTLSLIKSMRDLCDGPNNKKILTELAGKSPDFMDMPIGCRFGARCKYADRICNTMPDITITKHSTYRCHNPLPKGALEEDDD